MNTFSLKIVTPDGVRFDGKAQSLKVRTTSGDVSILDRHANYVAPLGMGEAVVTIDGEKRYGACIGGMVSVMDGVVTLVPTTFEWAADIDVLRAEASQQKATETMEKEGTTDLELRLAEARLKRALIRKSVATRKQ